MPECCPVCRKGVVLRERMHKGCRSFAFTCQTQGHKHFERTLNHFGILQSIEVKKWLAFLCCTVLLRQAERLHRAKQELVAAFGNISEKTFLRWRHLFQNALKTACLQYGSAMIGGKGEVVVVDETVVGLHQPGDDEDVGELKFSRPKVARAVNTRVLRKRTDGWSTSRSKRFKKVTKPAQNNTCRRLASRGDIPHYLRQ